MSFVVHVTSAKRNSSYCFLSNVPLAGGRRHGRQRNCWMDNMKGVGFPAHAGTAYNAFPVSYTHLTLPTTAEV